MAPLGYEAWRYRVIQADQAAPRGAALQAIVPEAAERPDLWTVVGAIYSRGDIAAFPGVGVAQAGTIAQLFKIAIVHAGLSPVIS
jgi:hypothetical protein